MKLYAWRPKYHGPLSFFVMAKSIEEARAAVLKLIDDKKMDDYDSGERLQEKSSDGTGVYSLEVYEEGEVVTNSNE